MDTNVKRPGCLSGRNWADGELESRLAGAVTSTSLFALASLTKPLVATAVMIAVEEGALELDAPVAEFLPEYRDQTRQTITPRHLLSHASGLPEVGPRGVAAVDVEPGCPPATRRIYSNEGYAVLGELIALSTGIDHASYVREAVFEPLGMDAFLGLPENEYERARMCASRAWPARGSHSSTAPSGGGEPPQPGVHSPPPRHMGDSSSCC